MASDKVEGAPTISKEDLENALKGVGESDLKVMCTRLVKSHEDVKEMIKDLEAEQDSLKDDNAQLRETIEHMMKEMQKLNIGASNCVDPVLEEGPLDFVGRFWEKVKPRDTGVVVSEHVGEIKRPISFNEDGTPRSASSPATHQIAQQVAQLVSNEKTEQLRQGIEQKSKVAVEQGKQAWGSFRASMGPLWQQAQGLLQEQSQPADSEKKKKKAKKSAAASSTSGTVQAEASSSVASSSSGAPAAAANEAPAAASGAAPASPKTPPASVSPASPAKEVKATESAKDAAPADDKDDRAPGSKEQISSTILIEALLKIDDGSIQTLHVRAEDRCKEVAHRFIQEHSLKAWFEEPLTAWLKKVEADAESFPVKLEGDLMEIRRDFAKSRPK